MILAPPPDAAELKLWFDFFTAVLKVLEPVMLAALTAVTVFFGRRAAAKTDEVAATVKATAELAAVKTDEVAATVKQTAELAAVKTEEVAAAVKITTASAKQAATATTELIKANTEASTLRKDEVDQKLGELQTLGEKTHTLVNGQHGVALQTILEQAVRLAELTKLPDDIAAVETARQNVEDHEAKQVNITKIVK